MINLKLVVTLYQLTALLLEIIHFDPFLDSNRQLGKTTCIVSNDFSFKFSGK